MPNIIDRLLQNAPGAYHVDSSCTDCDLCRSLAPAYFSRENELGFSIVHRQPETSAEIAEAEEALQSCPTNSIGNDGTLAVS